MLYSKHIQCRLWPFFIAILLLAMLLISLFGGLREFYSYKQIVQADLELNPVTLHYFIKDFIQRRVQKLIVNPIPNNPSIASFSIYTNQSDLQSLDSDLPASAKEQYVSGYLKTNKPELKSQINFRYRGGLALHWLYEKKSLRIKLPPFTTYQDEQSFDLVNISTPEIIIDLLSYAMAKEIGLLTPDYFPARVFINNNYNGLHFFLSGINESLLRKKHLMPGSIYSGDTISPPNPFGRSQYGMNERAYSKVDENHNSLPLLWTDARLWKKDASRNAQMKHDRTDINTFINTANQADPILFMKEFNQFFDHKKFFLFWALDSLTGTHHHDLFHNHKIYFDPYKGKFEPIEWDLRFWNGGFPAKDLIETPLLRQVKFNPLLEYERDKITYELLQRFSVKSILKKIDDATDNLRPELEADPYRQAGKSVSLFTSTKASIISMKSFNKEIAKLKKVYKGRHHFLTELYKSNKAEYQLTQISDSEVSIKFSISGNNPIIFSPWEQIQKNKHAEVNIFRVFEGKETAVTHNEKDILYPGKQVTDGNNLKSTEPSHIMASGIDKLTPSPLIYEYNIRGNLPEEILSLNTILVTNAITNTITSIEKVSAISNSEQTKSIHPWSLSQQINNDIEHITLNGTINISKNTVYKENQIITIQPGTLFKISKNKSLIFYGKVIAEGTEVKPIIFAPMHSGENWGSLIIQGQSASDSKFKYIHVTGGSLTKHKLISYPGQFNIHNVSSFEISNCRIYDNKTGDDALHIAYSKGSISNCHFENTAFDALDIDISDVTINNTEFTKIGNDAIDLMTSRAALEQITVNMAQDKCISIGEESNVNINNSFFEQCNIGIAVKDKSKAFIQNVTFSNFGDSAISLFRKNPRYSNGGIINGSNLYGLNSKDIKLDSFSVNKIPLSSLQIIPSKPR